MRPLKKLDYNAGMRPLKFLPPLILFLILSVSSTTEQVALGVQKIELTSEFVYLPAMGNGLPSNGKFGLAYGYRWVENVQNQPLLLGVSHYHYWSSHLLDDPYPELPFIPFVWCANLSPNRNSSFQYALAHIPGNYEGLFYVGNEAEIAEQCLKYIDWDVGECDVDATQEHCLYNFPGQDPNIIMADLLFAVREAWPQAKIVFPHMYAPHFPYGSEGLWSLIRTLEMYELRYNETPPIYAVGLHYGDIPYEVQRALNWIEANNKNWKIVISEFGIKPQTEASAQKLYNWLHWMNDHPDVLCFQYYTNTFPFWETDPTIHLFGAELFYWLEDHSFELSLHGETYVRFGNETRGQNQDSICLDGVTAEKWIP